MLTRTFPEVHTLKLWPKHAKLLLISRQVHLLANSKLTLVIVSSAALSAKYNSTAFQLVSKFRLSQYHINESLGVRAPTSSIDVSVCLTCLRSGGRGVFSADAAGKAGPQSSLQALEGTLTGDRRTYTAGRHEALQQKRHSSCQASSALKFE